MQFEHKPEFLTSDRKRFRDALSARRFTVTHKILPRCGICAA